ncbi:type IV secretory system conjugative DNA transfer family protein [Streptomyces litchfieldiae]|uniref:Type VI secretion protein n=1 Tax=Streptomyces litchfieldiae TaxID=3075543 RepID=A0ABU2MYD0_9ACTN|nr:type VI secretion protein [Streptomyces sp. DSM 44938]MDT0346655.1 type VI secretion protein [Streptomyces sp. DSM 44938]
MSYDQRAHQQPAGGAPGRRGGGVPDALLVGTLAVLVGVTALTWTATGLAGWLRHGEWPTGVTFVRTAHAMRSLLTAPGDIPAAWPEAAPADLPSAATVWLVFLAQLIVLFSTVLWVTIRLATWRARREHRRSPASTAEPTPVPAPAPEPATPAEPFEPVEPTPTPTPEQLARPVASGDTMAAVLKAPEGLIVLDPHGRLWSGTARQRGKMGPVHVYDPGHVTDAPVRLRWTPQQGCEEMPVARARAAALLEPVRPVEPIFRLDAEAAETLLRCYLHAAALSGAQLTQIQRWAHGKSPGEPAKVLRTHSRAAGGAAMELESTLTGHPVRRDAALDLVGKALAGLEQLHIRQACSPGRVDALALGNIAGEGATLYVVGDHPETAGLRAALVDAVTTAQPTLRVVGN